jgi:zinc transport system ATP-binding protein
VRRGPAVQVRNLTVRLGGQSILDDVSFDVPPASVHAIVGPNGGGKTTLVRALLGQVPCDGTVRFEAVSKPVIGYVPQSLDLDRTMPLTVLDILAVMNQRRPAFLGRSGRHRRDQDAALARVGLAGKEHRLFGVLSGGERQRLLFAQALVPAPDLLVLDEPTSNMDEQGDGLIEALVMELARDGVTVLWVNHDWEQVRRVASGVTAISHRVTAHGTPADILAAGPAARRFA